MRLTRLYDPQLLSLNQTIELDPFAARHMALVLRAQVGDEVIVFNGQGGEYRGIIQQIKKQKVLVELVSFDLRTVESPLKTHLIQVISAADKMDYTIQKATELGVTSISPVFAERGHKKLDAARSQKRDAHWRRVIISACEQCQRNTLPQLNTAVSLQEYLAHVQSPLRFVADHRAEKSLKEYVSSRSSVDDISVLIGAEGGLSEADIALANSFDFHGLQIGTRILRTETAAVTTLSLFQYAWGDFS
jgi:16S rRNA (uracil1498-N3)-methyltransferase